MEHGPPLWQAVYASLEDAQAPGSDGGETITEEEQAYADSVNKVAAAFPTSSVRNTTDEVMAEIHCNFGTNFGFMMKARTAA